MAGCIQAAIAVSGASLSLARTTVSQTRANVLKVLNGGSCRETGLRAECGEVDYPLVNVLAGSSVWMASSVIGGGAEAAVHHTGANLELIDVTFDRIGGPAVVAAGAMASVERCTASPDRVRSRGLERMPVVGDRHRGGRRPARRRRQGPSRRPPDRHHPATQQAIRAARRRCESGADLHPDRGFRRRRGGGGRRRRPHRLRRGSHQRAGLRRSRPCWKPTYAWLGPSSRVEPGERPAQALPGCTAWPCQSNSRIVASSRRSFCW